MNEQDRDDIRLDVFLREALLEANRPAALGINMGETIPQSEQFQQRMVRLLRSPFRQSRPGWARFLQTAACLVLISSILFAGAMTNPTARAWVERIVAEWLTDHTDFHFFGAPGEAAGAVWRPEWVPEGYKGMSAEYLSGVEDVIYTNEMEEEIIFSYMLTEGGNFFSLDNEHSDMEEMSFNGQTAYWIESNADGWPNYFVWLDQSGDTVFMLMGEVDQDTLLKIAESVKVKNYF